MPDLIVYLVLFAAGWYFGWVKSTNVLPIGPRE